VIELSAPLVVASLEFPLVGPAGEVIDLRRVFLSHGIAELPPMRLDQKAWSFEITVPLAGIGARTLTIVRAGSGHGLISVTGQSLTPQVGAAVMAQVRHVLSLDVDLTPFYAVAADDRDLAWVLTGAGRMVRSPTVFEDVVKTICTTNTSWGGTTRMVNALVQHLGEKAPGAPPDSPYGRAFPIPAAMAAAPPSFYKKVAGAGYRGPYLKALATSVTKGRVDLEALAASSHDDLPDDEVDARLQALPGVGPYAAAHIMLMLGRPAHPRFLDSPDVREAPWPQAPGWRSDDRAPLQALRALCGPGVLAVSHSRLAAG
jgi:N-glycosylase/DNA lyase